MFPTDRKKIRERIRRYERALERELKSGYGGDGYGKRFLFGPLYMLLNDLDGALASYAWYEEAFPDDGGDPCQYLSWALALHCGRRWHEADDKLYRTMTQNVYLVPHLLGDRPRRMQMWHSSNLAELEYALQTPPELLALWNPAERAWARQLSNDPAVTSRLGRYIEIHRELNQLRPGQRRTDLVNEAYKLERSNLETRLSADSPRQSHRRIE
jgi:hypothetical protein